MTDVVTPVPGSTPIGDLIGGKLHGREQLFDTTGTDAMGLVTDAPAGNTILGRLKAIATALFGLPTIGTRAYGTSLTRLAYGSSSTASAAITGTEVMVHNCGTARCYIKNGSAPTASVNDTPIEPGEKFHLRITTGDKIAAIQDSASGNLNIVPVA